MGTLVLVVRVQVRSCALRSWKFAGEAVGWQVTSSRCTAPSSGPAGSRFNPPTKRQESPLSDFLAGSSRLPLAEPQCGRVAFSLAPGTVTGTWGGSPRRFEERVEPVSANQEDPPPFAPSTETHSLVNPFLPATRQLLGASCSCPRGGGGHPGCPSGGGGGGYKARALGARGRGRVTPWPAPTRRPEGPREGRTGAPAAPVASAPGRADAWRVQPCPGVGAVGPAVPARQAAASPRHATLPRRAAAAEPARSVWASLPAARPRPSRRGPDKDAARGSRPPSGTSHLGTSHLRPSCCRHTLNGAPRGIRRTRLCGRRWPGARGALRVFCAAEPVALR